MKKQPHASNIPTSGKIYIGKVKDNRDIDRMGRIRVWIPELSQAEDNEQSWFTLGYCSPFGGATNLVANSNENDYNGTQKSYGMWFQAPDLNNLVMVVFVNEVLSSGYYIGCVFQDQMNHMIPGLAGDHTSTDPKAEYNKKAITNGFQFPKRPEHDPLLDGLTKQGLSTDTNRGTTTSSARRTGDRGSASDHHVKVGHKNQPSTANGILTPGGHQIVLDDGDSNGDSKFIRFRTVSGAQIVLSETDGYAYIINRDGTAWVELSETGNIDMWAKNSVSVRSENNINLHSDKDVNIEATNNINIRANTGNIAVQCGKNYDLTVGSDHKMLVTGKSDVKIIDSAKISTKSLDINTDASVAITAGSAVDIKGVGIAITSDSSIDLSGTNAMLTAPSVGIGTGTVTIGPVVKLGVSPGAAATAKIAKLATDAVPPKTYINPNVDSNDSKQWEKGIETVVPRMPTHEPYPKHDTPAPPVEVKPNP